MPAEDYEVIIVEPSMTFSALFQYKFCFEPALQLSSLSKAPNNYEFVPHLDCSVEVGWPGTTKRRKKKKEKKSATAS